MDMERCFEATSNHIQSHPRTGVQEVGLERKTAAAAFGSAEQIVPLRDSSVWLSAAFGHLFKGLHVIKLTG